MLPFFAARKRKSWRGEDRDALWLGLAGWPAGMVREPASMANLFHHAASRCKCLGLRALKQLERRGEERSREESRGDERIG